MFLYKNTDITKISRVEGIASNTSFLVVLLMLCLFFPLLGNADGLFDFQMKLAKGGSAEAQYKVGEMYETGFGVKEDQTEAMNWIKKSANQGHETAGFKLLYWDVQKNGLKGENKADVDALKKKANAGNAQAQFYVGKMNAYGVGMKKNPDKAIKWFNKAALVGVLEAEREMSILREDQQIQAQANQARQKKKKAELKAKQERAKQAKLEQQRKLKTQKDAEAKAHADKTAKQIKAKADAQAQAKAKANKEKSYQEKMAAKKEAQARQRKANEQARLKKQAAQQKQKQAEFESDPCSGKSARFLSTCR
jgi:septal ring factor EnvC (AmiA/AmiB activator)